LPLNQLFNFAGFLICVHPRPSAVKKSKLRTQIELTSSVFYQIREILVALGTFARHPPDLSEKGPCQRQAANVVVTHPRCTFLPISSCPPCRKPPQLISQPNETQPLADPFLRSLLAALRCVPKGSFKAPIQPAT
jgi:hypothetical protein